MLENISLCWNWTTSCNNLGPYDTHTTWCVGKTIEPSKPEDEYRRDASLHKKARTRSEGRPLKTIPTQYENSMELEETQLNFVITYDLP